MKSIYGGLVAAVLISLPGVAFAEEFVNSETDPRALVVRDAEIARCTREIADSLFAEIRREPHQWYQFVPVGL